MNGIISTVALDGLSYKATMDILQEREAELCKPATTGQRGKMRMQQHDHRDMMADIHFCSSILY